MVLIGHSGWPRSSRTHEFGVELFFVLSGLLITSVLLAERARTGSIDLPRFYVRRARRLVPAMLLLLVVLVATIPFGLSRWRPRPGGLIGGVTYTTNFLVGSRVVTGNLAHLWSLAVEEHFYLVWPALLIVACGRGSTRVYSVIAMIVALIAASFVWRWALVVDGQGDTSPRFYTATDLRVVSPLLGSLAAVLLMRFRPTFAGRFQVWLLTALGAAAAYYLIWVSTGPSITHSDPYWLLALPMATVASITICMSALAPRGPIVWLLGWGWLRWLGRYSYSGYLWHYPVFIGIGGRPSHMTTIQTFWGVTLTLAAAYCSTNFVEKRWRNPPAAATPTTLTQQATVG